MAVLDDIDVSQSSDDRVQRDVSSDALPLGEVLSAARTAKKLTQQEVSDKLRYSIKQIDALESNKLDVLPDAMITRGFIRNYAKLLEIDAEPLLASYRGRMPDKQLANLSVHTSMREVSLTKDRLPWLNYILGSIVVLLFLLAWFFYMDYRFKVADQPAETVQAPTVETVDSPVEMPLPEIALPAAERGNEDAANVSASAGVDASAVVASPADTEGGAANQPASASSQAVQPLANPAVVSQPVNQSPVEANAGVAKKKVSFSVSEQTWVSVTDKSGSVVFEKTLSAGAVDGFEGLPPLNVVVGNAKAAQLTYAGQSVALTTSAGSNVARIRLE